MSFISWSLEFITGGIGLTIYFLATEINTVVCFALLDVCLNFVIIPSSYILNTEVTKAFIIAQGWCKSFRCFFCSNQVGPAPNEDIEMDAMPNVIPASNVIPAPIPTISGNIIALARSN